MMDKIEARIEDDLHHAIIIYAAMNGTDKSKAIRQILKSGLSNISIMELQEKWKREMEQNWLQMTNKNELIKAGKNLIMERDSYTCRHCKGTQNLEVYNIDQDPINTDHTNLIVLCKNCADAARRFHPKRRVKEDFLEWFYLL